jgi:hypothetical protein
MVSLMSLWLPILLSAIFVFVASSVIHMVLPYHHTDYRKVPSEDEAMDALRRLNIPPGDYMMPRPGGSGEMRNPEFIAKMARGPVAMMTVMRPGTMSMGKNLAQWFVYSLVMSLFSGYLTSRAVGPGTQYLEVFRFVSTSAFMGYSLGLIPFSIWVSAQLDDHRKSVFDGLVYACVTAGTFGWLWPR